MCPEQGDHSSLHWQMLSTRWAESKHTQHFESPCFTTGYWAPGEAGGTCSSPNPSIETCQMTKIRSDGGRAQHQHSGTFIIPTAAAPSSSEQGRGPGPAARVAEGRRMAPGSISSLVPAHALCWVKPQSSASSSRAPFAGFFSPACSHSAEETSTLQTSSTAAGSERRVTAGCHQSRSEGSR